MTGYPQRRETNDRNGGRWPGHKKLDGLIPRRYPHTDADMQTASRMTV
jgi:hypothetical protein